MFYQGASAIYSFAPRLYKQAKLWKLSCCPKTSYCAVVWLNYKMSKKIKRNFIKLVELGSSNPSVRSRILKNCSPDLITAICECAENILNGNVKVTENQRRRLQCHKGMLRKLRKKRQNANKKRLLLTQHGGFLPALMDPILGIASSLIGGLLNK